MRQIIGAVDIGGTKIAVGLVDMQGRLLFKSETPSAEKQALQDGLDWITTSLRAAAGLEEGCLVGIGIGCTGPVDPQTGRLFDNSFLTGWEGEGLVRGLEKSFGLPVAIENDADAAALAEAHWGSGKNCQSFIYLTVSTGIGGGIILGGRLYRGAGGAHPEVGHHIIDPTGPGCFCGAHGCWESLASGPAMAKWFTDNLSPVENSAESMDAARVCQLAEQGHPLALQAVARESRYLGLGLANLINLFTPDRIALGGGVMRSWPLFREGAFQVIRQVCGLVPYERTVIELASLGSDTPLLGAALTWYNHYQPLERL